MQESAAVESISNAIAAKRSDVPSRVIRARMRLELPGHVDIESGLIAARMADELAVEKNPKAKRILALAHLRSNQFPDAIIQAEEAVKLQDLATFNHLVIAIAKARSGDRTGAQQHLNKAQEHWPEDLREPGTYVATLGSGDLWIDSADELLRLQEEAERYIAAAAP